jgi:Collagen triple helix repeat (20 copies)
MRFLSLALNGLNTTNGLTTMNGETTKNGLNTMNGWKGWNGLSGMNGLNAMNGLSGLNGLNGINGLSGINGLTAMNGHDGNSAIVGWNALLVPARFSQDELGSNWIDTNLLGSPGVGDLRNVSSVEDGILDNRHIPEDLKEMLCNSAEEEDVLTFRSYFSALIELAWPKTAALKICCSDPAGKNASAACLDPDLIFTSTTPEMQDFEAPVFAPHFLTEKFEAEQQEALTAGLIPKFNTVGQHLVMDLHGILDLGLGTLHRLVSYSS